jgi:hypothetical protein
MVCGYQLRATHLVTIGLAVDYVGGAQVGQWLAVEQDVIKTGTPRFASRDALSKPTTSSSHGRMRRSA